MIQKKQKYIYICRFKDLRIGVEKFGPASTSLESARFISV